MATRRDVLKAISAGAGYSITAPASARDSSYAETVKQTWRHNEGVPTGAETVQRELVRYATLAPNGHNTQPWRFRLSSDRIDIVPDLSRRTPVVDPDDHHLWVSLGCAAENLRQAAAAFGRHAEVAPTLAGVRITLSLASTSRSPVFEAIPLRQSTRGEYDGRALSNSELRQLETAVADGQVQTVLVTDRTKMAQIEEFVVAGNTAQMADPAFVAELKAWIRFSERDAVAHRDGLFSASSGNPTLPSWFGSVVFGLVFTTQSENEKYVKHLRGSAGVAVFAAEMKLGSRRPNMVVRFGHGRTLPPSLRRPVDALIEANE
jgi:hypothetical protein